MEIGGRLMGSIRDFEPLWGSWIIEKQIGKGSYGGVYLARRAEAPEFCSAIKHLSIPADESELSSLLSDGIASDREGARIYYEKLRDDIIGEIRFMYRLRGCANIVAYEDHLVVPKKTMPGYDIFIRMELLEPLTERTVSEPLSKADVCRLGLDICTAFEALERERIVHRDVKPANILVNKDGTYKLADFGVARQMERTRMVMSKKGTYSYMAPEVYRGEEAGTTADLYSLGLVMHRLLNGNRAPFLPAEGNITYQDTELALARRLAGKQLPRPAYADDAIFAVIGRACAFLPQERYASAADMRAALQRCLDPAAPAYSEEAMPWERGSMGDTAYTTDSPRSKRIRAMQDGDAQLAASLQKKYVHSRSRELKRSILQYVAFGLVWAVLIALIWSLIKTFLN